MERKRDRHSKDPRGYDHDAGTWVDIDLCLANRASELDGSLKGNRRAGTGYPSIVDR